LKVTDDNGNADQTTRNVTVSETPSIDSLDIQDGSYDHWFWGDAAEFEVGYSVIDPDNTFKNVTVTFANQNGGDTKTTSSTNPDNTLSYSKDDTYGDTYEITVRMYDSKGNLVFEQTYTETADGNDENGEII
jgi:hypothetical protein